jgi:hypothetical protein
MVRREFVQRKLQSIAEGLGRLARFRDESLESLTADFVTLMPMHAVIPILVIQYQGAARRMARYARSNTAPVQSAKADFVQSLQRIHSPGSCAPSPLRRRVVSPYRTSRRHPRHGAQGKPWRH